MQIRFSARHTTISERDRRLIEEKIERLGRFLPGMDHAEIHFSEERNPRITDREVCEVTLEGHGHHVRCKAAGPDHLTATDRAVDKLENKLHKLKSKLGRKPRHKVNGAKVAAPGDLPDDLLAPGAAQSQDGAIEHDAGLRIVKSKKVERLTLNPIDAAERMELVSHSFYFFTNADTGRPAVVYVRSDGDIGLIDEAG